MTHDERLEIAKRVLELDEKATDGPWVITASNYRWAEFVIQAGRRYVCSVASMASVQGGANAKLVSHTRTSAPALARAVIAMAGEIEKLRESLTVRTNDVIGANRERAREAAENATFRAALEKIQKGDGPFSREPLQHAENCITSMVDIADAALAQPPEAGGEGAK